MSFPEMPEECEVVVLNSPRRGGRGNDARWEIANKSYDISLNGMSLVM